MQAAIGTWVIFLSYGGIVAAGWGEVAHELFRRYKGRWEVYQVAENQQAIILAQGDSGLCRFQLARSVERVIDGRPSVLQSFVSVYACPSPLPFRPRRGTPRDCTGNT